MLKHLFGGFSILLWVAAVLAFVSYGVWRELASDNLYIGVVLVVVVLITGAFSYYQEAKSLAVMKGFAEMVPTKALVLRGGHRTQVDAASLVVGDVVDLHPGDKVCSVLPRPSSPPSALLSPRCPLTCASSSRTASRSTTPP